MNLAGYIAVVRRRAWVILICIIAGAAGGFLQVERTPKLYSATSTYFVALPSTSTANPDLSQNAVNVVSSFLLSFQQLASKRSTADAIAQTIGQPVGAVYGHLSSKLETGTFFIDVTAEDSDPAQARVLANAAAQTVVDLIPKIQSSSASAAAGKNVATAYITDDATLPGTPFQPTPRSTISLGIVLGLVASVLLMALLEALDRTVRSVAQITDLGKAPLLGIVPRRKGAAAQRMVSTANDAEPYRALRTALNFLDPDSPPVVLLFTSPIPGDGKTTTAVNVATAMSEAGERVLMIDGDLRRAQLSRALGAKREAGLSGIVTRQVDLAGAVMSTGTFDIIPAGANPPNPSELLGSQAMSTVLEEVRRAYDVVIIDAPPVLAVTDAVALAPLVDAVVVVCHHGRTPRTGLAETQRRLEAVGSAPAGVVLNSVPKSEATEYYGKYVYTPV